MAQTDHLHALPPGFRIQEYEIVEILGSGGFGITYLGRDINLKRMIAIKEYLPNDLAVRVDGTTVLPKSRQNGPYFRWGLDRFLDEAYLLARFDHPAIVRVMRFFEAHGTAYTVMEYVEGQTLSEALRGGGKLCPQQLRTLLFPLLDGLEEIHRADFLHRDIKPSNIILRTVGSPVLIDFGAARLAVSGKSRSVPSIGTPGFAPIEQYVSSGKQGPWTDIYSLGAVAYRCLTGEVPPEAPDRFQNDPIKGWRARAEKDADPQLLDGIESALAFDRDGRPQSVAQWRDTLREAPTSPDSAAAPPEPGGPTDAPREHIPPPGIEPPAKPSEASEKNEAKKEIDSLVLELSFRSNVRDVNLTDPHIIDKDTVGLARGIGFIFLFMIFFFLLRHILSV